MPTIRFTAPDSQEHQVHAEEGENMMKLAVRNGVPGIEGECGGEMSCATCHVYISEPWKSTILSPSVDEQDLLEFDELRTADSRLSCQLKCTSALDGIHVVIPEQGA